MPKYRRVQEQGVTFVFKLDDDDPSILHIFARHLTEIDDALDVWFEVNATETWNATHARFERYSGSHGLFWFWIDESKRVVMIVTCFTL